MLEHCALAKQLMMAGDQVSNSDLKGGAKPDFLPPLRVLLCSPRGFCAGVDRAIQIVERALRKFGKPVYVRHEIVHNRFVVESLKLKGAIFVDELDEISDDGAHVIFSAHGVAKKVFSEARLRNLIYIDATCPLVVKVHSEAEHHWRNGREIILIGHAGHPEVIGTMGQLPEGAIKLVEIVEDIAKLRLSKFASLAYITQTTLSVDDAREMVMELKKRFPKIVGAPKKDICYATTNRQKAVKLVAGKVDVMIVVGSENSSNSQRLREVAERVGCSRSFLVQCADDIDWRKLEAITAIGITAGASAPENLVEEIIAALDQRYNITLETVRVATEDIAFNIPKILRDTFPKATIIK